METVVIGHTSEPWIPGKSCRVMELRAFFYRCFVLANKRTNTEQRRRIHHLLKWTSSKVVSLFLLEDKKQTLESHLHGEQEIPKVQPPCVEETAKYRRGGKKSAEPLWGLHPEPRVLLLTGTTALIPANRWLGKSSPQKRSQSRTRLKKICKKKAGNDRKGKNCRHPWERPRSGKARHFWCLNQKRKISKGKHVSSKTKSRTG